MIKRIEAYRYRCFSKLALDLGKYNVLAGPNGAGKTTLLDIPTLLGDMINQRRNIGDAFLETQPTWEEAPRAHTLKEVVHKQIGSDFVIAVEADLPAEITTQLFQSSPEKLKETPDKCPQSLRYELSLEDFNGQLQVKNEFLYLYPPTQVPERGGGLQGDPDKILNNGRPKLRETNWRPVVFREEGAPVRYCEETDTRGKPNDNRLSPTQLALGGLSVDTTIFPAANWFRAMLDEQMVFYDPQWPILRQASRPGQSDILLPSGCNLPWVAKDLKDKEPDRFKSWVEHVQTALPIEDIDITVREGDYHAYFVVKYEGGYEVTSSGLSDGTLRIMALTIVPYLLNTPNLIVTEEPENGIHPQAIEVVLQSLTSVYDGQVWLSTHSPLVIANTDLDNVLCSRMGKDGAVTVVHGNDHPKLKDWKGGVDLGTLFAAGVFG